MISLPLKTSSSSSWAQHISSALYSMYGASASDFRKEIEAIDRMRDAVIGVSPSPQGRDLLYRYFAQIELMSLRIPMRPFRTEFTWKNLYDSEEVSQTSVAFEKACVLYNLAAVLSHLGAASFKENDFKQAYHDFCCAAGILQYAGDTFLHAACIDVESHTLSVISQLMLAQAQHCFYLKAEQSQPGSTGLLAKLATSAVSLYTESEEALRELYTKRRWGEAENITELKEVAKGLKIRAQLAQSRHAETQHRWGDAIAHLREAKQLCSDRRERTEIGTELKTLERNNDLIYHERAPAVVPEIAGTQAAKPLPLDSVYPADTAAQVIGNDIFSRIIPVTVHEKASLYSEMKAQFLRDKQEAAQTADSELSSALEYMRLPEDIARLRESPESYAEVPSEVLEWSVTVGSAPALQRPKFDDQRHRVLDLLRSQQSKTTAIENVHAIKQSLINAAKSDEELQTMYDDAAADLAVLSATSKLQDVFRKEIRNAIAGVSNGSSSGGSGGEGGGGRSGGPPDISLLDLDTDMGPSEAEKAAASFDKQLDEVAALVAKLRKIQAERQTTLADLRDRVHEDDATQLTVAHQDNPRIVEEVFKPELQKFDPQVRRLAATERLQRSVISDTMTKWKAIVESSTAKKITGEKERAQVAAQQLTIRLSTAFDTWQVLREGIVRAQRFYADLERRALNIEAPAIPAKPPVPKKVQDGLSGYTTPSAYNPSMYQ